MSFWILIIILWMDKLIWLLLFAFISLFVPNLLPQKSKEWRQNKKKTTNLAQLLSVLFLLIFFCFCSFGKAIFSRNLFQFIVCVSYGTIFVLYNDFMASFSSPYSVRSLSKNAAYTPKKYLTRNKRPKKKLKTKWFCLIKKII